MKKKISIYFPVKVNAEYNWNLHYNRFNCPWENKLVMEGEYKDEHSVDIDIYLETKYLSYTDVNKIIEKIIRFYEEQRITIGIKDTQLLEIIVTDNSLEDAFIAWKEFDAIRDLEDIFQRGMTIQKDLNYRIFVSIAGCIGTIWRDEETFKRNYPEYYNQKPWNLTGFVYYVLAHELCHVMIPLNKNEGGEIFPILLGSRFAEKNNYIYVPQGRELNRAWKTIGIRLSRKSPEKKDLLSRCKKWLGSLPEHLNHLR